MADKPTNEELSKQLATSKTVSRALQDTVTALEKKVTEGVEPDFKLASENEALKRELQKRDDEALSKQIAGYKTGSVTYISEDRTKK